MEEAKVPTITKYESEKEEEEEEEEVGLVKTVSSLREKAINQNSNGSSALSSCLSSLANSGSDSDDKDPTADENGHAGAVGSAEDPEPQPEPEGFHGVHEEGAKGNVFFDEEQGFGTNGVTEAETVTVETHQDSDPDGEMVKTNAQNGAAQEIKNHLTEIQEILDREEDSHKEHYSGLHHPETNDQISAEPKVIEEEKEEPDNEEAYHVEKVIENQDTHDLYCPNCNSCITKRVVLKRRKRKVPEILSESKRGKLDIISPSPQDANIPIDQAADTVFSNDSAQTGAGNDDSERGPCLFRCLTCFSIFIPFGNGFKLFPASKDDPEKERPLITQQEAPATTSWFSSIFGPKKKVTAVEQVEDSANVSQAIQSQNPNPNSSSAPTVLPIINNQSVVQVSDETIFKSKESAVSFTNDQPLSKEPAVDFTNDQIMAQGSNGAIVKGKEPALDQSVAQVSDGTSVESKDPALDFTKDSSYTWKTQTETTRHFDVWKTEETTQDGTSETVHVSSTTEKETYVSYGNKQDVQTANSGKASLSPIQPSPDTKAVNKVTIGSHEIRIDTESPLKKDNSQKELNFGGGVVQADPAFGIQNTVEKPVAFTNPGIAMPNPSQNPQSDILRGPDVPIQGRIQVQVNETGYTESHEGRELEILKSIVYGGLVESITSLGVISSAAGSGASTLNILVLGLANLVGGLVLIIHHLQELKEEIPGRTNEQEDRYQKLLGRRVNFRLHAFVAILSFIIFGLIPPVVYGFSFSKTPNNGDYKSAAVFAASLVCVISLAIGKARAVGNPPRSYVKTVMYYASIAIAASGISYVVGDLLKEVLEKYDGWFDSPVGLAVAEVVMPVLGRKGLGFGYSSN